MSEPSSQQLQRHKDTVKDTLQGLLDTVAQVPGLIHESTSKELGVVISATAIKQGAYNRTQESLGALPAELSAFDQVLDDLLVRSQDISQSLATLRSFNSRPAARTPLNKQHNTGRKQQ